MLQSVSAHLMEDRRPSTIRRSSYRPLEERRSPTTDHFLAVPHWHGTMITEDYQPSRTAENPIGWAMFNPLPIKPPLPRPRNRVVGE